MTEFFVPLDRFLELDFPGDSAPLLGTSEYPLLAAGGLVFLTGKAGAGKTLLVTELAFHLATGEAWHGFPVSRPVRVAIVENEGSPREFQSLLRAHHEARDRRPFPASGGIFIPPGDWGTLRIDDPQKHGRLRTWLAAEKIDVLIADPLKLFGAKGAGSPDDTSAFVVLLGELGAGLTCILLHHLTPGSTRRGGGAGNAGDEVSGAWPQHADTHFMLHALGKQRVRLSVPKLRLHKLPPSLLLEHAEPVGFTLIREENDASPDDRIVAELVEPLGYDELRERTGLSRRTLERHVTRLVGAGVLAEVASEGRQKRFARSRQLRLAS